VGGTGCARGVGGAPCCCQSERRQKSPANVGSQGLEGVCGQWGAGVVACFTVGARWHVRGARVGCRVVARVIEDKKGCICRLKAPMLSPEVVVVA
jgi:hypothetical protein